MIRLKTLLQESLLEQRSKSKLRILFVGDDNMKFARSVLKRLDAIGTVLNYRGTTSEQILKQVRRRINDTYDVVVIMASSYDGAPGKAHGAIKNLQEAFKTAKQFGAQVIAISNPSKSYLTKDDAKYKDHGYPSNDEIGTWVNNQTISDSVIDVNSLDSKYLASDHTSLNIDAQKMIVSKLSDIITGMNIKPKSSEPETSKTKTDNDSEDAVDSTGSAATAVGAAKVASDISDIDVTKGEMGTPKQIFDLLIAKGLSPAGAAGILGNMKIESNFKTNALGDSGTSVGLVQWHASRKDRLMSWAKERGLDPMSVDGQIEYLWWELTNKFTRLADTLKTISDPWDAAYQFAKQFERPANIAQSRMQGAQQYFDEFNKTK
jgi:hypothetical protein